MLSFADKFVAHVDLLGFKDLLADTEKGSGMPLADVLKLLECLGTGKERERFDQHGPLCCPCVPRVDNNLDFRVT
jgi:hypothetical protein